MTQFNQNKRTRYVMNRFCRWLVVAVTISCFGSVGNSQYPSQLYELKAARMGTHFVVKGYAASEPIFLEAAKRALARAEELEQCFSDYRPDSEINLLTRANSPVYREFASINRDLGTVLLYAKQLHDQTHGAVDVTVGPVTRLWRRARRRRELPTHDQVDRARLRVGFDAVELRSRESTGPNATTEIRLHRLGMQFDFGAIAKGFAADEALQLMEAAGINSCLVDAGGDLALGRPPPGHKGWQVQFRMGVGPDAARRCLLLSDCGVATSGGSDRGVTVDGKCHSHIVQSSSGAALESECLVTVIGPTAMTADGWATALCLMAPEKGMQLVNSTEHMEAYGVQTNERGTNSFRSSHFDRLLRCDSTKISP